MAKQVDMPCKCENCGFEWVFVARSKADAARFKDSPQFCSRPDCNAVWQQVCDRMVREALAR